MFKYLDNHRIHGLCEIRQKSFYRYYLDNGGKGIKSLALYIHIVFLISQRLWWHLAEFDYKVKLPYGLGTIKNDCLYFLEGTSRRYGVEMRVKSNPLISAYRLHVHATKLNYLYWNKDRHRERMNKRSSDTSRKSPRIES